MNEVPLWMEFAVAGFGFLQFVTVAFIVPIRGAIDRLKESDDRLREDFNAWRVEVAKDYVRRDEVSSQHREVLTAIQRLESQIGTLQREKQDK